MGSSPTRGSFKIPDSSMTFGDFCVGGGWRRRAQCGWRRALGLGHLLTPAGKKRAKHFADCKIISTFANTITHGSLAEWLGTGLQNRLQQFDSARNLKKPPALRSVGGFLFPGGDRRGAARQAVWRYGFSRCLWSNGFNRCSVRRVYHRDSGRNVPWHIRADETSDCRDARLVRPTSDKYDKSDAWKL